MISSFSFESINSGESGDDSEKPDLGSLLTGDRVLIKTDNSLYQFSVTDAALRQGRLCGGAFGDEVRSAILVVSISEDGDGKVSESPGLKVGARAVFYIFSYNGMERMITSTVNDLTLIRDGKAWPLPVSPLRRMRESSGGLRVAV